MRSRLSREGRVRPACPAHPYFLLLAPGDWPDSLRVTAAAVEESSWSGDSGRGRVEGAPVVDLGQSEAKLVESKREKRTDIEKAKLRCSAGVS